jgi:hypothetical protein
MTPTPASAARTPFGELSLTFPYAADLVDALKQEIPARFRRWEPDGKRWLVMGAYAAQALDLLLEHFPNAQVPDDQPRRITGTPARKARPPTPLTLLPAISTSSSDPDEPDPDALIAAVRCPWCAERRELPVRPVVHTAEVVAKRELITPEMLSVCPCGVTLIVAFYPDATPARVAP